MLFYTEHFKIDIFRTRKYNNTLLLITDLRVYCSTVAFKCLSRKNVKHKYIKIYFITNKFISQCINNKYKVPNA